LTNRAENKQSKRNSNTGSNSWNNYAVANGSEWIVRTTTAQNWLHLLTF